jgi:PAS domain S-box-containing protein
MRLIIPYRSWFNADDQTEIDRVWAALSEGGKIEQCGWWDAVSGLLTWDEGQYRIFGVEPDDFAVTIGNVRALVHPEDWDHLREACWQVNENAQSLQTEFRVLRPSGELRWCMAAAGVASSNGVRVSGVTVDITDRKLAEERQTLLAREFDHCARNALAVVQSIVRLTMASNIDGYVAAVEDRIGALARAHALLSDSRWQRVDFGKLVEETIAPFWTAERDRIVVAGPKVMPEPTTAQSLALALYELATNAVKYGPLSVSAGWVRLTWEIQSGNLVLDWTEIGGPRSSRH